MDVRFPKFKMEQTFELNTTLNSLGMKDAFDAKKADFNGISDSLEDSADRFFISLVTQKSFVQVDEKGTEATAATVGIVVESIPTQFLANHPFIYLIRHNKTGSILFLGRMMNPREGKGGK